MTSSRWDAQGNIYLVTTDAVTAADVRALAASTSDGVLQVLGSRRRLGRDRDLEPRRLAGRDVGQRHADRRALARRLTPSRCVSGRAR